MGREVRRVPADWNHPTAVSERNGDTYYVPLLRGPYAERKQEFDDYAAEHGIAAACDWLGDEPDSKDYMPSWTAEECTHYQMYESVSEGTPISPVLPTPEKLADWLAQFAGQATKWLDAGISRDAWLNLICSESGSAPSFVSGRSGDMVSGVQALYELDKERGPVM